MMNFEKIKSLLKVLGKNNLNTFSNIKKKIRKLGNQIKIENIDTSKLINKDKLNQYLLSLQKKYPMCSFSFVNCTIDGIEIKSINTQSITFDHCCIKSLNIYTDNKNIININECNFIFSDTEEPQKVSIKSDKVNLSNCTINIETDMNHRLELGKGSNSAVNIKNHIFINDSNAPFNTYINSNSLTLHNYNAVCDTKLIINKCSKAINYLHCVNSNVVFDDKNTVDINMILIDSSNIYDLVTDSQSIELSGDCSFNNVNILKCSDMVINEYSSLTTRGIELNVKYLECLENSEINDITNRFRWLTGIGKIVIGDNFTLKYNNEVVYTKVNTCENQGDVLEVFKFIKNKIKIMR